MAHIKVAIADDHKIFRSGVINTLIPYENISFVLELMMDCICCSTWKSKCRM